MLRQVGRAAGALVRAGTITTVATTIGWSTDVAWAVDVVNADKVPHEIVVNGSDGQSNILTVSPKGKLLDVCESCVVLLGRTSAEANGKMIVRVEDGKVSVDSR